MTGKVQNRNTCRIYGIVLGVICSLLTLLLVSCAPNEEGVEVLIGLSQPNLSDNLQLCIKAEIQERCASYKNARCISYDAGFNDERQAEDIGNLLKLGIDALVVVTVEPDPISDAITQAYETGIPVIIIGYAPENGNYTARIFTDNKKVGEKAGEYVLRLAGKNRCVVLEILGDPESAISIDRKQGFQQAIKGAQNIQKEYVMSGYWSQDRTVERMKESDFDSKNPPVDLIFAHNDSMAVGAALGVLDFGRKITIIGVGAYPIKNSDLEALEKGQIDAVFSVPPGGKEAVDTAFKLLNGDAVPALIELETALVTKETVQERLAKE